MIETREHKMPYKHIAAQLKKTELACRLHYHQLSFGSKSRRKPSISSIHSYDRSSMTPPARMRQSTPQLPLPSFSPPQSPEDDYRKSAANADSQSHKPILPKPVISLERAAQDSRSLRLVTESVDTYNSRQYVDIARLDRIYEANRLHFWSTIARTYGCNLSPSTLEDAWCRAHSVSTSKLPPTPRGSPQSAQAPPSILTTPYSAVGAESARGRGFTPVNIDPPRSDSTGPRSRDSSVAPKSSAGSVGRSSFAISSLLTEDKEIRRSPTVERKLGDAEMTYAQ